MVLLRDQEGLQKIFKQQKLKNNGKLVLGGGLLYFALRCITDGASGLGFFKGLQGACDVIDSTYLNNIEDTKTE